MANRRLTHHHILDSTTSGLRHNNRHSSANATRLHGKSHACIVCIRVRNWIEKSREFSLTQSGRESTESGGPNQARNSSLQISPTHTIPDHTQARNVSTFSPREVIADTMTPAMTVPMITILNWCDSCAIVAKLNMSVGCRFCTHTYRP